MYAFDSSAVTDIKLWQRDKARGKENATWGQSQISR